MMSVSYILTPTDIITHLFFSLCPVIGFRASTYSVVEGTNSFVTLILFREGGTDLPTAVNITTVDGTASTGKHNCYIQMKKRWKLSVPDLNLFLFARLGEDYVGVNTEVVFVAGATETLFNISILDNNVRESIETFNVILTSSAPNTIISDETRISTVTITDTDRKL